MKLFHCPGFCSLGIHILLEEVGQPYEIVVVDLKQRGQFAPTFLNVNPKGKVPALVRNDGSVLTEFPAIAFWLAKTFPEADMMGKRLEEEARTLELLDYIVGSIHKRGFTFVAMPMKFLPEKAGQDTLRAYGLKELDKGPANLADRLGDQPFLQGSFSIADAALFYLLRFVDEFGLAMPGRLQNYFERMQERPSVAVAMCDFESR